MKTILAVAALLVCLTVQLFGAGAAVPYQQLYTNHFDNSLYPLVKIRFNTNQFNYSDPTNGITIPDSAVIGLQYWTNVSGKLFPITGGTNRFFIAGGSTATGSGTNYFGDDGAFHAFTFTSDTNALWAEIGGVYFPNQVETTILLTNAVVSQALAVDGAFVEQGFSGVTANDGTNNLNPFRVGTFIVNSTTNDPAACIIDLSAGSGTGQMLAIEKGSSGSFTLKNAGLRWDDPSASNILRYVDWVPTYAGETILLHQNQQGNWVEWGRSPQATNFIGTNTITGDIFATNVFATNLYASTFNGTSITNWFLWTNQGGLYHPSQLQTSMHVTNLNAHGQITLTDRPYNFPANYANSSVLFDYTASGNLIWLGGSTNPLPGLWFTNVWTTNINNTPVTNIIAGSSIWTNRSGTVGLINQALPIDIQTNIVFGPGNTNVLFRDGASIEYTNGAADVKIEVVNGSGTIATIEAQATSAVIGGANSAATVVRSGTDQAILFGHMWAPVVSNSLALGSYALPWNQIVAGSTNIWKLLGVTGTNPVVNVNGTNYTLSGGTGGGGGTTINPTDGYVPYRANSTTFSDSPFYTINSTNYGFAEAFHLGGDPTWWSATQHPDFSGHFVLTNRGGGANNSIIFQGTMAPSNYGQVFHYETLDQPGGVDYPETTALYIVNSVNSKSGNGGSPIIESALANEGAQFWAGGVGYASIGSISGAASLATNNIGSWSRVTGTTFSDGQTNIGHWSSFRPSGTAPNRISIGELIQPEWYSPQAKPKSWTNSSMLAIDNWITGYPLITARSNGVSVFAVNPSGSITFPDGTTQATAAGPGGGLVFSTGTGSPEGVVTGSPGDTYWDTGPNFEYVKVTGSATTTGWAIH